MRKQCFKNEQCKFFDCQFSHSTVTSYSNEAESILKTHEIHIKHIIEEEKIFSNFGAPHLSRPVIAPKPKISVPKPKEEEKKVAASIIKKSV